MPLPSRPHSRITLRSLAMLPVAAAIVHLIATFLAMTNTSGAAFARLGATLQTNQMTLLAPVSPGQQPLPFLSADARYSVCRFETKQGPVAVRAVLPDLGWTLGIYHRDGSSAYFATAAPGRPSVIALTIVPGDDRFLGMTPQALGTAANADPQLTVSAIKGLIVLRAPDKGPAYRAEAEAILAKAACVQKSY